MRWAGADPDPSHALFLEAAHDLLDPYLVTKLATYRQTDAEPGDTSPEAPAHLKLALLMTAAHLAENREAGTVPDEAILLITNLRNWSF